MHQLKQLKKTFFQKLGILNFVPGSFFTVTRAEDAKYLVQNEGLYYNVCKCRIMWALID